MAVTAVLEINDAALAVQTADGRRHSEPGFAHLDGAAIRCGDAARASAWLEPQHHFNQYWQQLGQQPLAVKSRLARHFGDIAFAQLQHLCQQVGGVERAVLAVPGSLSNPQLALLLGMAKAAAIDVVTVVDSALAGWLHRGAPCVHLDLHLHHCVVTALEPRSGELAVSSQEVMPELGVLRLHNLTVGAIADQLIATSRFDPLHDPASEQWLFDQVPAWLEQLRWQEELNPVLVTRQGERPFRLRRASLTAVVAERLAPLRHFLARHAGLPVVLSHTAAPLAALVSGFAGVEICAASAVADNALRHLSALTAGELRRLRAVPLAGEVAAQAAPVPPLHLLCNHRALALAEPVSVLIRDGAATLMRGLHPEAVVTLVQQGSALHLIHRQPDADCRLPESPRAGAALQLAGIRLPLIEVASG